MKRLICSAVIMLFALSAVLSANEGTLMFGNIKSLSGIIPQDTKFYKIDNNVAIEGPYYVFTISCDHDQNYQVRGITDLLKACHEIAIIEWYRSTPQGNQVWTGTKDSLKGIGKGAKQVVLHPGDSSAALGRKVAKTGRTIGRFFKGLVKKTPKSSTGEDLSSGAGNFLTSENARIAAYELHLDAYSSNPYVTALLNEIAKKRLVGSLGVSAATFLIPGSSLVQTITTGALTPGAFVDETEKMIRDNDPAELNRELEREFRVSFSQVKGSQLMTLFNQFLQNPNYDPRQKAYITLYFEQLGELNNLENALYTLANAPTVEDAEILESQMQMLSAAHNFGNRFSSFATKNSRIAGRYGRGDIIMILPYDYADDTKLMLQEIQNVPDSKASRNIWLIGDATADFVSMAEKNGITSVKTGILHYKAFQNNTRIIPKIKQK